MKSTSCTTAVLLALALAFCLLPANRGAAQEPDPFDPSSGGVAVPQEDVRFDVEFVDTPAPEAFQFIAMKMEELGADPLNIVYSKTAEAITLPMMALRQINFEQFVSFINRIGGSPASGGDPFAAADSNNPFFPEHSGPRFGITDTDGIWYFWAEESASQETPVDPEVYYGPNGGTDAGGDMGMAASQDMITRVFALNGDTESTLGLIEETLGETQRHSKRPEPTLKFHEPSSTLIVSGSSADLKMIEEMISVMEAREDKKRQQESNTLAAALAEEIKALQHELQFSKRMAQEETARLSARAEEEIATLQAELAEGQKTYTNTHPKILELQAELTKALEELKKAK